VKLLYIMALFWVAPAILVLLAMAWSLWPKKTARDELVTELEPVLPDTTTSASEQKRYDQQHEQPGKGNECDDDLKSVAER
jgi:hypothetical protein